MRIENLSIAVISDIHGNSWALNTVLEDIRSRSTDLIINLGDSLYGPLDPGGTYEIIRRSRMISVSGNEDRLITGKTSGCQGKGTLSYVRKQLPEEAFEWLESLNSELVYPSILYACHGTQYSDSQYMLHKPWNGRIIKRESSEICKSIENIDERIIICGHSHIPGAADAGGRLVVNPGSVGCPAFDDDDPEYHIVENASPRSNYCLLKISEGETRIEQISLVYDHEKAALKAESNKRYDWAEWIRTGRVNS